MIERVTRAMVRDEHEFDICTYCGKLRDRRAMYCEHCSAAKEIQILEAWEIDGELEEEEYV